MRRAMRLPCFCFGILSRGTGLGILTVGGLSCFCFFGFWEIKIIQISI